MPQDMCPPGMFMGRIPELKAFEQCLFQTLNDSPQHFLIEGERGIGKSSLLFYMELLSRGEVKGIESDGGFKFICVSIDLASCTHELQIIQKIARDLKRQLIRNADLKAACKGILDFMAKWEVMQVKFNRGPVNVDADVALQELVYQISSLCKNTMNLDGLLILMDEADSPPASANLGSMLKMFQERLTREQCRNVMIGIAGLPTLLPKLTESHESSPRLFQIVTLEPLEPAERDAVIQMGLDRANKKNPVLVGIEPDAMDYIREMSEGYPHFLQQFAHSAFAANSDETIDVGDVMNGAFGENGAFDQLGQKFFSEKYNILISTDEYRTVLDAMSTYGDKWLRKKDIVEISGVKEGTVTNALKALKKREIVVHDATRQGFYRLPTKSFAAWINASKRRKRETVYPSKEELSTT